MLEPMRSKKKNAAVCTLPQTWVVVVASRFVAATATSKDSRRLRRALACDDHVVFSRSHMQKNNTCPWLEENTSFATTTFTPSFRPSAAPPSALMLGPAPS